MFEKGDFCNDYLIDRMLDRGKDGRVYLATSKRGEGEKYALKSILIEQMNTSQRKLINRCAAQVLLQHKNIVGAREFFFYKNEKYLIIVMELCSSNLLDYLEKRDGKLDQKQKVEFINGIVSGIQTIHRKGYIHKDLHMQNIFNGVGEQLKIGDFGSIKDSTIEASSSSKSPNLYSPPEQFQERGQHSNGSDIYSAGVIIMQLILGKNFLKGGSPAKTSGFPEAFLSEIKNERYRNVLKNAFVKVPQQRKLSFIEQRQMNLSVFEVFEQINANMGGDKLIKKDCQCSQNYTLHYQSNKLKACIKLNQNEPTHINLKNQRIGQKNFQILCSQKWSKLKQIDLTDNNIEFLKLLNMDEWKQLTRIDLDSNPIRDYRTEPKMIDSAGVKTLYLNYNKLTKDDIMLIFYSFSRAIQLTLRGCEIGNEGLIIFVNSVRKDLKYLDIGKNKLTDEALDILAKSQFNGLKMLFLGKVITSRQLVYTQKHRKDLSTTFLAAVDFTINQRHLIRS